MALCSMFLNQELVSFFVSIPSAMFLPISLHGISVSSFSLFSQLALHPSSLCVFSANISVMCWCPWLLFGLVVSFLVCFLVSILLGSGSCILPVSLTLLLLSMLPYFSYFCFVYFSGFSSCYAGESSWAELSYMYFYLLLFPLLRCRFLL